MKNSSIRFALLLFLLSLWACNNENPMDKEQYVKQIYLVGAYDHVLKQTVKYNDTENQETFISVAASGSLGLDQDITVKLKIVPEEIPFYNEKYIGHYSTLPYYSALPEDYYDIPSMETTLKKGGEVFETIPVIIDTRRIHCDSNYAIAFQIASITGYQTTTDSLLLLGFKMENDYSTTYAMSGTKHELDDSGIALDTARTGRNKILKAVSQYEVRMFYYDNSEKDENIATDCMVLKINPENNSVSIRTWDPSLFRYPPLKANGGNYDPVNKTFHIWYTYTGDDGKTYKITETLENR